MATEEQLDQARFDLDNANRALMAMLDLLHEAPEDKLIPAKNFIALLEPVAGNVDAALGGLH